MATLCMLAVRSLLTLLMSNPLRRINVSTLDVHGLLDDGDPQHVHVLVLHVLDLLHNTRLMIINT